MTRFITLAMAGALIVGGGAVACAATDNGGQSPAWNNGGQQGQSWDQPDVQGQRATHALNMLEAQGYGRFSHFRKDGADFTAEVTKNGTTFPVLINPDTNQILPEGHGAGGTPS